MKKAYLLLALGFCLTILSLLISYGLSYHATITLIIISVSVLLIILSLLNYELAFLLSLACILTCGWITTWMSTPEMELRALMVIPLVIVLLIRMLSGKRVLHHLNIQFLLFIIAIAAMISFMFTTTYVTAFKPVPGFDYLNLAINLNGVSSDVFIVSSLNAATTVCMWWCVLFIGLSLKWDEKFRRKLLLLLLLMVIINIAVSFLQIYGFTLLSGREFEASGIRPHGLLQTPHAINNVAVFILLFLVVLITEGKRNYLIFASSGILLLLIILGGGFSALVVGVTALIITGTLYLIAMRKGGQAKNITLILILSIVFASFLAGLYFFQDTAIGHKLTDRILRLSNVVENDFAIQQFRRMSSWAVGTNLILRYPFAGIGVGTFPAMSINVTALEASPHFIVDNTLNQFVEIGTGLGLPVLLLFIAVLTMVIFRIVKNSTSRSVPEKILYVLPILIFFAFGFVGPHLNDLESATIFWLMVSGLLVRFSNKTAEEKLSIMYLLIAIVVIFLAIAGGLHFGQSLPLNDCYEKIHWHLGYGNYEREDGGEFWTGKRSIISFIADKPYVHVRWRTNAGDNYQPAVQMLLNSEEVYNQRCVDSQWVDSYFYFGKLRTGYSYLALTTSEVFVPSERIGSTDSRALGVKIGSIDFVNELPHGTEGFWDWEGPENDRFIWSKDIAYMNLPAASNEFSFSIKSGKPDISNKPVTVSISLYGKEIQRVELTDTIWKRVKLNIEKLRNSAEVDDDMKYILAGRGILKFSVDGVWIPKEKGGKDSRLLGIALKPDWQEEE